jgi:hypothetical protein
MPFTTKGKPYTKSDVESIAEGQIGVYGIYKSGAWIYVGRGDIRERMLAHLNGDNSCITNAKPTGWCAEVTNNSVAREKELIEELSPSCSQKVG